MRTEILFATVLSRDTTSALIKTLFNSHVVDVLPAVK